MGFTITLVLLFKLLNLFVVAQIPVIETEEFNLTQALIDRKVDLTDLPKTDEPGLATRAACTIACKTLTSIYGRDQVYSQGSAEYQNFTDGYWSAQQMLTRPQCIFLPSAAAEVSTFVLLARLTQCPFAPKSGGHAAMSGASSSQGGITVALKNMNEISLSIDKKVASIGPGNVWSRVYSTLEKDGLTVIGGRVANIGVGGLVTGGGISFLSNKHGWACDNVESYEVVIANGDIVTASEDSHPDLYWALRGGGNNFGIVTKFNLFTYPQGQMYGGSVVYEPDNFQAALAGFHDYTTKSAQHDEGMNWLGFAIADDKRLAVAELAYTKNETKPEIFSKYFEATAAHDGRTSRTLTEHTFEILKSTPSGYRECYHHFTTLMNPEFNAWTIDVYFEEANAVKHLPNSLPAYIFHAITAPQLKNMANHGGNALGLDESQGPLVIHQVATWWQGEEHDQAVYKFLNNFYNRLETRAKELGIFRDFLYMNYASQFQDPIASYGSANKERLQNIAKRYDPTAVFQRLHPGYFKLDGGPYRGYEDWLSQQEPEQRHDEL